MRPTRDDVIAAYETMLGREPESEDVIAAQCSTSSVPALLRMIASSEEFTQRLRNSPFHHFASTFDGEAVVRRHARPGLRPTPGKLTNFLGVLIDPKYMPHILDTWSGIVEEVPIPANWHADVAEFAAALRSVDLASGSFVVAELGCGWGCWINNTGVAARTAGLAVQMIGVEGDEGHIDFAREACADNGFEPEQVTLHRGIAAARSGFALFPKQSHAGEDWGLEPLLDADEDQRREAAASGLYHELPLVPLDDLIGHHPHLDLLHVDIQGGEADLIENGIDTLTRRVAYLVIGTHSRAIEGRIISALAGTGWHLEIERPAIQTLEGPEPLVVVDGVQGWRNLTLRP